jgi:Domain of unknown function (DUF4123)
MSDTRTDSTGRSSRGNPSSLPSLLFGNQVRSSGQGAGERYMLLDTARDPRIYARLMELGSTVRARSLYQGDIGESLAHVSPYLLSLQEDQPESRWFAEAGFGQSWGLFIIAPVGFDELRRHLRKFNIVYDENGAFLVFRFYDPRVLRLFLPTCTSDELRRFFGPIESFLTETEGADALLRFTLRGDELMQARLTVQA